MNKIEKKRFSIEETRRKLDGLNIGDVINCKIESDSFGSMDLETNLLCAFLFLGWKDEKKESFKVLDFHQRDIFHSEHESITNQQYLNELNYIDGNAYDEIECDCATFFEFNISEEYDSFMNDLEESITIL